MTVTAPAPSAPTTLTALARLEALCDPGSLRLMRTGVRSRHMNGNGRDGDGVLAGTGSVAGRQVACYAQDASFVGGSLGEAHADSVVRVLEFAERARCPVIGFVESAGARIQEGTSGLAGYARIFRAQVALSGRVPQLTAVCGASAGGGSYSPALTDLVVMTRSASMFLTGPGVVAEVMGEQVGLAELGGPAVHERNGVCQLVADDDLDAVRLIRQALSHLPQHAGGPVPGAPSRPPAGPAPSVPSEARRVYDIRDVLRAVTDADSLLEIAPRWARNVVCALARIEGRSVGIVANQPRYLGGVLDAESAAKAARFVRMCDAFSLPLAVFVDTPGFLPGTAQEKGAVIRHGAKLVHAFAAAQVPAVTVVLRKAFGGAYIAMNSKDLGADMVLAWPQAQIGVMAAKPAVGILHRRAIGAAEDPDAEQERLAGEYAERHLGSRAAVAGGHVDEIVEPGETRAAFAHAFEMLAGADRTPLQAGNIPL